MSITLNFYDEYAALSEQVNSCLESALAGEGRLYDAMRYSVLSGGKRLRPVLLFAVGKLFALTLTDLRQLAIAVEFVHASSLIHDDLPALDNDRLRRGQPTCHIRFGEGVALLAGDALLGLAFKAIASIENDGSGRIATLLEALGIAVTKLCVGQVLDLESTENHQYNVEKTQLKQDVISSLENRHSHKTGALFSFCCAAPVLYAQASTAELEQLEQLGRRFGLLFQITDDILDVVSTVDSLGKEPGGDARRHTATYISELGIDGAREAANSAFRECMDILSSYGDKAEFLRALCDHILSRSRC